MIKNDYLLRKSKIKKNLFITKSKIKKHYPYCTKNFDRFLKQKITVADKLTFFLSSTNFMSSEAYKLFSMLEMQISAVLLRSQLVPFFFMIPDLCFYRLVFINGVAVSDPYRIVTVYDSVQLPIFLYQLMNYRQNRFYYYPKYLLLFFKTYWGQFIDYTSDKL